ncbi:MAG: hypothetical protein HC816_22835, partial [Leptolyngbyaceae cyanobacterium RM1_1_2]|nr:hypothetical protein [Leptolyngbyaceae cyanobacterium RM1_1_2]
GLDLPPQQPYRQLWQRYSQGVRASNLVQQDYLVAKRAFETGCNPKQIALMLIAGSPYVRQIHQSQGKDIARDYVNQTAQLACRNVQKQKNFRRQQEQEL